MINDYSYPRGLSVNELTDRENFPSISYNPSRDIHAALTGCGRTTLTRKCFKCSEASLELSCTCPLTKMKYTCSSSDLMAT
ncbi:hypothetical protein GQ600_9615 [Phytophthora cactorum]|nr:hypothetical protein GQ600_9615 [Phytophthora cactorum]